MFPSYADHSPCDWRSGIAVVMYLGLGMVAWWACAYIGAWIGAALGYPAEGGLFGAFGIPIMGVLVNGWRSE